MKAIRYLLLFLPVVLLSASCANRTSDLVPATVLDYSEIAGCGYVLQLEDRSMLEPINLQDFDPDPTDGEKVQVRYRLVRDINSICNAGDIVEITEFRKVGYD
jgi:hypothetical protein